MQIPPLVKNVGAMVLIGGGAVYAWKNYDQIQEKLRARKIAAWAKKKESTVKGLNASNKVVTVNLTIPLVEIYDALRAHTTEDEERAIRVFKNVPVLYIKRLEHIYKDVYGYSLRNDFAKYLNDTQFIKVKYFFK